MTTSKMHSEKLSARLLGVDIGKTKLAVGTVSSDAAIDFYLEEPTDTRRGGGEIMPQVISLIRRVLDHGHMFDGIGVGTTGMVAYRQGIVIRSGSLANFKNIPIKKILEEEFGSPVYVENDVHAATIGEHLFGAGRDKDSMALLYVGTGVGVGIVVKGELLRGSHELAGQIAHIPLFGRGDATINEIMSGSGIAKRGAVILGHEISTAEVFKLASEGHHGASEIVNEAVTLMGSVVAWLHNVVDPEIIVLGGGVVISEETLVDRIREQAKYFLKAYSARLPGGLALVKSPLGHRAGVMGGAASCLARANEDQLP